MVDLQIALRHFFEIDETTAAIFCGECVFDDFGKAGAPFESSKFSDLKTPKAISRDLASITARNAEGFDGDAALPNIACRAGRVIVAVAVFEFFRRDRAVLEDVVNDRSWTLCGN